MPAPTGDDHPATRRELRQLHDLVIATISARIAELRTEMIERIDAVRTEMVDRITDLERRMNDRFASVERRISNQTRVLLVAMVLMWGTLLAAMDRLS